MQNSIVTVDIALFSLREGRLQVLLHPRQAEPFKQQLALPGGFIHTDSDADAEAAARRVLADKLGLRNRFYLEQLYTFADSARDPRGWSVSISFYAVVKADELVSATESPFTWREVDELPRLAFDHNRIVDRAVRRLRDKSAYSSLPCHLLGDAFTLTELQRTYEQVLGIKLDKSSFRRKLDQLDFLSEVEGGVHSGAHRPAQLYRLKRASALQVFNRTL